MAGSYGTLAAMEELTVKVLPGPEAVSTVVLYGLDAGDTVRCLCKALALPHEVSGAAYVPASLAAAFGSASATRGLAALRLEGPPPSVAYRQDRLKAEFATGCEAATLDDEASSEFWRKIRDVTPFAVMADRVVWRVSIPPSRGLEVAKSIAQALDALWYLDWGGGLLWLAISDAEDGGAPVIRNAIHDVDGRVTGHATLIRSSAALRHVVPVFEPQPPALAALNARVKQAFDPRRILNPGRMVAGS